VAITILGALAVGLGIAVTFSLRYWVREQEALTGEHALMVAATARAGVEAALAHGQLREVRETLNGVTERPPVEGWRIVDRDGLVLMSSARAEEGHPRPGDPLPNMWDIPSQGMPVGEPGMPEPGVIVPLSGVTGMGSHSVLELLVGGGRMEQAIKRALNGTAGIHVSFDLDAMDPDYAPGVGTPSPGGLSFREAHLAMEIIADHGRMTSLDIVEVNPVIDEYNRTAELAVELASSAFGKKIL